MRRALLIGSQTYGLEGVAYDLSLMDRTLRRLNFTTVSCCGAQASRAGILAAWRELIAATAADDAVVVYYAGHGGQAPNPDWQPGSSQARYLHFIVPTDMDQSQQDDFRGILNTELSHLLAALTAICKNVTVLLDCCHAARLTRCARARARALPRPWDSSIAAHLAMLKISGCDAAPFMEANPHAVCLAAAGGSQSAYEDPSGETGGYFTTILAEALEQVGEAPVSWEVIGRWVREQVLVMEPRQRPEWLGPTQRLLFDRSPAAAETRAGAFTFFYDERAGGTPSMRGGRLHGVANDNLYAVLRMDETGSAVQPHRTTARVIEVLGGTARLEIRGEEPLDGAPMIPLRENLPKRLVAVAPEVPSALRMDIEASRLLGLAPRGTRAPLARLVKRDTGLVLLDGGGKNVNHPTQDAAKIIDGLARLARALTLRELAQDSRDALHEAFEFAWGRVQEGRPEPLPFSASIRVGERIFISITNRSPAALFVNLFDIGVSSRITLLNDSARSGYELMPEESWCFGFQRGVGLVGVSPGWPGDVPADGPRLESIIAIISDTPMDLTVLEGKGSVPRSRYRTELERKVAARCLGARRSEPGGAKVDVRYAIRHIDFELVPQGYEPSDRV